MRAFFVVGHDGVPIVILIEDGMFLILLRSRCIYGLLCFDGLTVGRGIGVTPLVFHTNHMPKFMDGILLYTCVTVTRPETDTLAVIPPGFEVNSS